LFQATLVTIINQIISKLFAQLVPEGSFIQEKMDNVIPIKGKG